MFVSHIDEKHNVVYITTEINFIVGISLSPIWEYNDISSIHINQRQIHHVLWSGTEGASEIRVD